MNRDEEDPDFKKVPPLSIYQFKGVNPGTQINIPEIAKNRKCTNIVCCFPMLLISLGTISFAIWVAIQVDVRRFVNGEDKCGNICAVKNTKVTKDQCEPQDYTDKKIANFHDRQCIAECDDKHGDFIVFNRCISTNGDLPRVYHVFDTILNKGNRIIVVVLVTIILTLCVLTGFWLCTFIAFWLFVSFAILLLVVAAGLSWYAKSFILGTIFTAMLVIALLTVYLLMRSGKHHLVIDVISAASKAIFKIPILLVFPLMTLLLLFGLIAFTIYLVMVSLANPEDGITGNVFLILWMFWTIGLILMFAFINGFQWMVTAGAVSQYFFTRDKKQVRNSAFTNSLYITIRYHLGTISGGALIITILTIVRIIAEMIRNKRGRVNSFVQLLYACILYSLTCIEELAEYLAKKAYVITAMHGKGLLNSGTRAIRLMWYFLFDLVMVDTFTYLCVAGASVAVSLVSLSVGLFLNLSNVNWYLMIFVILAISLVGVVLYFYFSLLNASIEATFLCVCEDALMNDGSTDLPYFMSNELRIFRAECTAIGQKVIDQKRQYRQNRLERQQPAPEDENKTK